MAWLLLLLTLLSYHAGVSSQPPWVQPASQSASLGGTAKLPCAATKDSYPIFWYQQKAGQAPRYVHYAGGNRGEGISDRFTASQPDSTGYLTITNLQADDEAAYHCAKWHSSGSQYVFGGGTALTVTGGQVSPPKVYVFPPSPEEIESKHKATVVCLVNDFSPPGASLIWMADRNPISNGVETTRPTKINDKYAMSSYLSLTSSEWGKGQTYTCKVTHEGTDYVKSVSIAECP